MASTIAQSYRDAVLSDLQALINAGTLGIVSLHKNPFGVALGAVDKTIGYPVFIMDLAKVGLAGNVSGYGEDDIVYDCQIVCNIPETRKDSLEASAEIAKDTIYDLQREIIKTIFSNGRHGEVSSGLEYQYSIYNGVYVSIGYFQITK
jgi:hypothetical protein